METMNSDLRKIYDACVIALTRNRRMKRRDLLKWINNRIESDLAHLDLKTVKDRTLRNAVSHCMREVIMPVILSSSSNTDGGYYLSSDPDEIMAAADEYKSRICVMAMRRKYLMIAARTRRGQLSIFS